MKPNRFWLLPTLFFGQASFLGTTFATLPYTLAAFLLTGVLVAWSTRTRHQDARVDTSPSGFWYSTRRARKVISLFFIAVATVGWRFSYHIGETLNPIALGVDALAHVSLALGLSLYILHPRFGHPSMLGLGMLVVMLSVAAGGASQSIAGQVAVASVAGVGFLFASRFISIHWQFDRNSRDLTKNVLNRFEDQSAPASDRVERKRIVLLFSAIALSIIVMATSAIAQMTSTVLPDVQKLVFDQLKSSFESVAQSSSLASSRYVRGGRIGSIRSKITSNPNEVALVAYAAIPPGYLRGNTFDKYDRGRWDEQDDSPSEYGVTLESFSQRSIRPSGGGRTSIQGTIGGRLQRFSVWPVDGERVATVEIKNDPGKGRVFFAPIELRWIEASAREIDFNSHDIIEEGINPQFPYIIGVSSQPRVEVLAQDRAFALTTVSSSIADSITPVARKICGSRQTARSKARAISSYFQSEYTYSLERFSVPGRVDPIVHFLDTQHPAHCEYFATATALLLRSVGVPTRYVTGYVAAEVSLEKEAEWYARNRDAHAWVEAYDDVSQTWFPVESTPGRTYQTLTQEEVAEETLADQLEGLENRVAASDTFIGKLIGQILSMRATDPVTLLVRFGPIPLLLIAAFFLWKRLRKDSTSSANIDDAKSRQMLWRVDRRVKKHALVRAPHETLHQFAQRVEKHSLTFSPDSRSTRSDTAESLARCAIWYREFAEARYRGILPSPFRP